MKKIRIATRGSQLALWQAEHIRSLLLKTDPTLEISIQTIKTQGDKILDVPLAKVGGKGLFVKEIEEALLKKEADLAVHSLKDVPMISPKHLRIAAYVKRESPYDLFLSEKYENFLSLPQKAVLGTSSLRRQSQALSLRPDLNVTFLRGNVETRLNKMKNGEYDAIILSEAGIDRLNLSATFRQTLMPPDFIPAVGQGVLALQVHTDNKNMRLLAKQLNDKTTQACALMERAFMRELNGGCQVPIAGYAQPDETGHKIHFLGRILNPTGTKGYDEETKTFLPPDSLPEKFEFLEEEGISAARMILNRGAKPILDELMKHA